MSLIHKLRLLVWRNTRVRKRYWFTTLIEIFLPLISFFIVVKIRNAAAPLEDVLKSYQDTVAPVIFPSRNWSYIKDVANQQLIDADISFTPNTTFTRNLMKKVRADLFPTSKKSFVICESEIEMEVRYAGIVNDYRSPMGVGIVFLDLPTDDPNARPTNFKYKIRYTRPEYFSTGSLFPDFQMPGPGNSGKNYLDRGFVALQLAMDSFFIGEGGSLNDSFLVQSFPYPAYEQEISVMNEVYKSLPMLTLLSFSILCISVIKRIVEEKQTGAKELMKMMGLQSWMVWVGWLINTLMVYSVTITLIVVLLTYSFADGISPLLQYTSPSLLWVFLMLSLLSCVYLCFFISAFFNHPQLAIILAEVGWYALYSLFDTLGKKYPSSFAMKLLLSLLPTIAMKYGFQTITGLESQVIGAQWDNLFSSGAGGSFLSTGVVMLMLIFDIIFYGVLTWYIEQVKPGKYGVAKRICFILGLCSPKRQNDEIPSDPPFTKYIEEAPPNLKVGIKVNNVRKNYGKVAAVRGVSLDIHKGEITVLLGHNGAGKTTLMSVLTGLTSPSGGSVSFEGLDVFENMEKFRDSLGMCPQENMLFPYLNTREHLIFFGMLKGQPMYKAKEEAKKLMETLNIYDKRNSMPEHLSGGMKRKLALAIAIIGDPKVLMLDEPTSGMDVESRRAMWDLLLSMRGNRTVILTTHHMEEADVLGDRIAIMEHGTVFCYGTSIFLKREFGAGYQLNVIVNDGEYESRKEDIYRLIKGHVDSVKHTNGFASHTELSYNLPLDAASRFPGMFSEIESKRESLGIRSIGVTCTTMEDVFLKVGELSQKDDFRALSSSHLREAGSFTGLEKEGLMEQYHLQVGLALIFRQAEALFKKKVKTMLGRWMTYLYYAAFPILLTIYTMTCTNSLLVSSGDMPPIELSLKTYSGSKSVIYNSPDFDSKRLADAYSDLVTRSGGSVNRTTNVNISATLLESADYDLSKYRLSLITAASFTPLNHTILFNTVSYHGMGVAVNTYTNALLKYLNIEGSITAINQPIQAEHLGFCSVVVTPSESKLEISSYMLPLQLLWANFLFPTWVLFTGLFIMMPNQERVSGVKHIQMMSSLSPILYWVIMYIVDLLLFVIVIVLALSGLTFLTDTYDAMMPHDLAVLSFILFLFGASGIVYSYVYSYFRSSYNGSLLIHTIFNMAVLVPLAIIVYIMRKIVANGSQFSPYWMNVLKISHIVLSLLPPYPFFSSLISFVSIWFQNNSCKYCLNVMPDACEKVKQVSYFEFESVDNMYGLLEEILYLLWDLVMYTLVLALINTGLLERLFLLIQPAICSMRVSQTPSQSSNCEEDSDVSMERDKVDAAKEQLTSSPSVILVVDNLMKNYLQRCKIFSPVKGISFTVKPGECFGLLGVNGAGKTTTFKMLTGDTIPTKGDASINNVLLSKNRNEYLSKVGYCPQFNALVDELTGREMLRLFAVLRGLHPLTINSQIQKWVAVLGLEEYQDIPCGTYSGGNKRKLNTGISLIGDPQVLFLDEPTSGVDPVSRKRLYQVMDYSRSAGQAVVLTSHSMEECEALCDRLTIMVDGTMKCIGSVAYLKNKYAQGFTIVVKMTDSTDGQTYLVDQLKETMVNTFGDKCVLKDQHKVLLHYQLMDTDVAWSTLFLTMEQLKQENSLVEDYTVSDTTLEQVFLSFARENDETDAGAAGAKVAANDSDAMRMNAPTHL